MAVLDFDTLVSGYSPLHFWKISESASPNTDYGSGSLNLTNSGSVNYAQPSILSIYPSRTSTQVVAGGNQLQTAASYNYSGTSLTVSMFIKAATVPSFASVLIGR